MNLAVLKYQFVTIKPAGIPDEWPAEIVNLGTSTELPGQDWVLMTEAEYGAHILLHQSTYDTWASSFYGVVDLDGIKKKISSAIVFGNGLLVRFAAENVSMGITASGKTADIVAYLSDLRNYVATGSLYAAVDELENIIANPLLELTYGPFLTVSRLTYYKGLIESFLETL